MINIGKIDAQGRPVISQGDFEIEISADSGTSQTIGNNGTIDFNGGTGIQTVVTAPNILTFNNVWDYEEILGSSGAFDITLNTIGTWSTNVKTIEMELLLRGTVSAITDTVYMFFNNDTTITNYRRQSLAASSGVAGVATANDAIIALTSANTSPANSFGTFTVLINNPNSANHIKTAKNNGGSWLDAGNNLRTDSNFLIWDNTSAITRIQIRTDNHPTDLWVANSYMRLRFIR